MTRAQLCNRLHLRPAELLMLSIGLFAFFIDVILIVIKGTQIDYLGYAGTLGLTLMVLIPGFYYRISGRNEIFATTLICTGVFIFYSACMSLYNYLLLPLVRPTIDIQITQIDAMFGYYWPDVMALAAEYPTINSVLKIAYMTTMPQITALVLILGLTGRVKALHFMIVSVAVTATLTICFWGVFPTLGAKSMYPLPDELWMAVNPIVDKEYALELLAIAKDGPGVITPSEIRGLIAFPSYHVVLALTAIYAAWSVPMLRVPFLITNLLILPATFIHGGHHFMDLPAGIAMFLLGLWLAKKITAHMEQADPVSKNPLPLKTA